MEVLSARIKLVIELAHSSSQLPPESEGCRAAQEVVLGRTGLCASFC